MCVASVVFCLQKKVKSYHMKKSASMEELSNAEADPQVVQQQV